MIDLLDELFDIEGNADFRKFMRYRFFGTSVPSDDILEIFMDYDAIGNENLFSDKDKIYFPYLALSRKLIFEHKKFKNEVKSKGINYKICWNDAEKFKESMDGIIAGLLQSKKNYVAASTREKTRKEAAARSRARKAKERAIIIGSEGEEDYDIDDDDREQEEMDQQLEAQRRRDTNHNPPPMVCT